MCHAFDVSLFLLGVSGGRIVGRRYWRVLEQIAVFIYLILQLRRGEDGLLYTMICWPQVRPGPV